jgi:hypothetical protein
VAHFGVPRWPRRKPPSNADVQWIEKTAPQVSAAKAERAHRLVGQEDLVAQLERLLFDRDPIGINFESNTDEYRPEAETITLRLPEARTEADLLRTIHEEFTRWFGESTAGPVARYEGIASEIWLIRHDGPNTDA